MYASELPLHVAAQLCQDTGHLTSNDCDCVVWLCCTCEKTTPGSWAIYSLSLQSTTFWTHQTRQIFLWWVNVSRTEEAHREPITLFLGLWCTQVDCGGKACVHWGIPHKHDKRNHPTLPGSHMYSNGCVQQKWTPFSIFTVQSLFADLGLT